MGMGQTATQGKGETQPQCTTDCTHELNLTSRSTQSGSYRQVRLYYISHITDGIIAIKPIQLYCRSYHITSAHTSLKTVQRSNQRG